MIHPYLRVRPWIVIFKWKSHGTQVSMPKTQAILGAATLVMQQRFQRISGIGEIYGEFMVESMVILGVP